jgi:hypothetical protein
MLESVGFWGQAGISDVAHQTAIELAFALSRSWSGSPSDAAGY